MSKLLTYKSGIMVCRKEQTVMEELGFDGVVYVPEYSSWHPRGEYDDQTLWERMALSEAITIAFWIPRHLPDMPAFTTNVEFGYWLPSGKVIYGRPNDAEKIKYLDWLYGYDYGLQPINYLPELLKNAIQKTNASYQKRVLKKNENN